MHLSFVDIRAIMCDAVAMDIISSGEWVGRAAAVKALEALQWQQWGVTPAKCGSMLVSVTVPPT